MMLYNLKNQNFQKRSHNLHKELINLKVLYLIQIIIKMYHNLKTSL